MTEQSEVNKPDQNTEETSADTKKIKELLSVASHERKNLQLLVEYFEKKIPELDERKQFFDSISDQLPSSLQKIDFISSQVEDLKTFDIRARDYQRVAKNLESNHSNLKRELENLHL
ncbi:MAG: hypothetical protein HN470_03710, partial [Nitrosomonadales bacterium]|nr:hypothetical protein [Nitrosomonadales bacterium]